MNDLPWGSTFYSRRWKKGKLNTIKSKKTRRKSERQRRKQGRKNK